MKVCPSSGKYAVNICKTKSLQQVPCPIRRCCNVDRETVAKQLPYSTIIGAEFEESQRAPWCAVPVECICWPYRQPHRCQNAQNVFSYM